MENEEAGEKIRKSLSYALPAIAMHGFKHNQLGAFGKIKFSVNPYAYLLLLVDNLQDWSRPTRVQRGKNSIIFIVDGLTFKDSPTVKKIVLSYILYCTKWNSGKISRATNVLDEKRELFRFLEPWKIGQKLNVTVKYKTDQGKQFKDITIPLCR
jgi:hypothetical protein